jgi:hypothetical protein
MQSGFAGPGLARWRVGVLGIAAVMAGVGAWIGHSPPAYADATCASGGGQYIGCAYLKDHDSNLNRTTYWDEWAYRSSLGATADHWYLRSNYYWGTEDSNRYAMFDEEVHMLPDTSSNVFNYLNGSSNGDGSVDGSSSTIQVRFWSTSRSCQTCNEQRDYSGLATYQRCQTNPGVQESVSAELRVPGNPELAIGWGSTWSPTVECVSWPSLPSDPWSHYLNLTLGDSFYRDKAYVADLAAGQIMPNGYNSSTIHIGMRNVTRFTLGQFSYTIGSGNWFDDYNYGPGTRNCDASPSLCPPAP